MSLANKDLKISDILELCVPLIEKDLCLGVCTAVKTVLDEVIPDEDNEEYTLQLKTAREFILPYRPPDRRMYLYWYKSKSERLAALRKMINDAKELGI